MKISQLISNLNRVSPTANKAIYGHVGVLCNGFVDNGENVTLFASGDSETKAKLESVYPVALNSDSDLTERQKNHYISSLISKCYGQAKDFDIIHSHFTLLSSFFADLTDIPTLISIHSPIDDQIRPFLAEFKDKYYISFSWAQRKQMPELNWYANIYHGVDTKKFAFNPTPKDYLFYLGRVTEDKGVHLAIETAKRTKTSLVIAGKSYQNEGYWHQQIEKHIDGKNVIYIGEQSFKDKIIWLQNAKAVLFPTQCDEVFGYVMIEAMACGTPVIAFGRGSVYEVIKDGKTGFIVNNVDEMVEAVKNVESINRLTTRNRAVEYFSIGKMISGYQKVYTKLLAEDKNKTLKKVS